MKKFVVDSCVFAKLFLAEKDREQAINFFLTANQERWQLLVPTLFEYEVLNIINIYKLDFDATYSLLEKYLDTAIDAVDMDKEAMKKALL